MRVDQEFSRYAGAYSGYDMIQQQVATRLISHITTKPKTILDLGCGRGAIVEKITWDYEHFVGVDFAPGMLELHPKSKKIECIYGSFDDDTVFTKLFEYDFDIVLSSSALQWSRDIEHLFKQIAMLNAPIALAIFTANTFQTLHQTAKTTSPLRDKESIYALQKRYFDAEFEVVKYQLDFDNTQDIFRYIKKSGVSGGRNILPYTKMKKLIREYPTNSLEFEVVFIYSKGI